MPVNKRRKVPESQQSRVLELLWILNGGPYALARQLDITLSVLNSWKRIVGKVPMSHVGKVSRHLKLSPYLINYAEVYEFYGKGPKWETVVKRYKKFDEEHQNYIFKGKVP